MPISKELKQAVLFAVAETPSSKTGGVQLAQLRKHDKLIAYGGDYIDRAIQANAKEDLIKFWGRRDPLTGILRQRWGWQLTIKGRKALGL